MSLPTITNVFRVTFNWNPQDTSLFAHNVLHFFAPSGDEADVFAALGANLTADMVEAMAATTSLVSMDILKLDGTSSTVHHDLDGTFTGQQTGDTLIAPAVIISEQTGFRGPARRGRVFLPFIGEEATDAGQIDTVTQGTMQDAWTAFIEDMAGDGVAWVVASYVHADKKSVVTVQVEQALGTLRRRQRQVRAIN